MHRLFLQGIILGKLAWMWNFRAVFLVKKWKLCILLTAAAKFFAVAYTLFMFFTCTLITLLIVFAICIRLSSKAF